MEYKKVLQGFKLLIEYRETKLANFDRLLKLAHLLQSFIQDSPYCPAYNGSLLDIIGGIRETLTSQIIANILQYQNKNGKYILLESFIKKFVGPEIQVLKPIISAERERLDVSIKDRRYAIVIENKLKNAHFQRNQLARYIAKLKNDYDENDIYLVIMPQFNSTPIPNSAGRLPHDWMKSNENRKCGINRYECWCDQNKILNEEQHAWCAKCDVKIFERLQNNTVKLHNDYAEWLIDEAGTLPSNQWPLKTCMMQFAYYLKGLYKTRFSNKLNMAIIEFLKEKLLSKESLNENFESIKETIIEVDQLKESIYRLKGQVAIELVKKWENELKKEFPNIVSNLDENGTYSFGLLVQGLWIGCCSGNIDDNDYQPYWSFYSDKAATRKQIKMIDSLLQECCMEAQIDPDAYDKVWGNTIEGDKVCKKFYQTAFALGYE